MDFKGHISLVITAVLVVAVVLAFVASASSIFLGAQTKIAAMQATDENGSLSDKISMVPARAVRVIVASPFHR